MRKKYILYWGSLLLLFHLACEKRSLIQYDSDAVVYLTHKDSKDTILYSFSKDTLQKDTIKIPVYRMGKIADKNAPYKISIDKDGTTGVEGVDFVMPEESLLSFKPGNATDTIRILIKRTAALKENNFKVKLRLLENESFKVELLPETLASGKTLTSGVTGILVDDILIEPAFWKNQVPNLGVFSRKKVDMLVDFMDGLLTYKVFVASGGSYSGILAAQSKAFQIHLNELEANGQTVYEADGSKMKMGVNAQ